ncbi:MAG: DEAD/DEAH box helicase [Candidatus Rifleibacteriota bacterium]
MTEQNLSRKTHTIDKEQTQQRLAPLKFSDFNHAIVKAVTEKGWKEAMPVQAGVAPYILNGIDVIVQSRTGSGKTAAFLLPICERLMGSGKTCQALVLVPTRELALQVFNELKSFTPYTELLGVAIYGGSSYKPQFEALKNGAQIVIGTPGRVLDHLVRGSLKLKNLKLMVFDEADEMLSMGFYKDMVRIGEYLPRKRTTAMFSATMPESVKRLAGKFLHEPEFLCFSGDGVHVSNMDHLFYVVDPMQKDRVMMRIIEMEDPESAIIFCNTRSEVEYVAALLTRFGYDADQLSGDLSQKARERVMGKLKNHSLRFLVATDVAARGIDISNLEYVFIYDMHKDTDQYIHRAGRTARAGNRGVAISFVSPMEAIDLKKFAKKHGISLEERIAPTEEQLQDFLSEKLCARLESELRDFSTAQKERSKRYKGVLKEISNGENTEEILLMLIDKYHQNLIKMGREQIEEEKYDAKNSSNRVSKKSKQSRRPRARK